MAQPQHIGIPIPCNSHKDEFDGSTIVSSYIDGGEFFTTNTPTYSPSITSFSSGGSEYLVSAFVYRKDATHRTVGFAKSTNGGDTWSLMLTNPSACSTMVTLPTPKINNGSLCTNLDEPQIIAIGGDYLVCVVRGWPDVTEGGGGKGDRYHEQPRSIPSKSGIFIYVSTNKGASWGYYNAHGYSTSAYGQVDAFEGSGVTTLEHPRVAFRSGFDSKGYVVWHKKTWSESSGDFRVSESKIGIKSFRCGTTDKGRLYIPATPVTSDGAPYYNNLNTSNQQKGPEMPSVAISPDGKFWIAYMTPHYADNTSGGNADIFHGRQSPIADWKLISGGSVVVPPPPSGVETIIIGFDNPTLIADDNHNGSIENKFVQGLYDGSRGYFYSYDSSGRDLSDNNLRHDIINLESGPSVQVAVSDPLSCNKYNVGYLFASGNGGIMNEDISDPTSTLNFYCSSMKDGGISDDWFNNMVGVVPSGGISADTFVSHIDLTNNSGCTYKRSYFFPVLKYVNYDDQYLNKDVFYGETSSIPRSYFITAYMFLQRFSFSGMSEEITSTGSRLFTQYDSAECRTAFSPDNQHFYITRYDETNNSEIHETLRRTAQEPLTTAACTTANFPNIDQTYWGKQIDICGEYGNLRAHPIWHQIRENRISFVTNNDYASEGVKTNNAECIIIKPFLDDHVANDPEAFPTYFQTGTGSKARFISTSLDYNTSTSMDRFRWSPYVYFNYKNSSGNWIDRPVGASVDGGDNAIIPNPYKLSGPLGIDNGYQLDYFNDDGITYNGSKTLLNPSNTTSTTVIPKGIYYANYIGPNNELGALNFSHQRKFVMTGNHVHTVFERDGNVFYSTNRYDKSTTDPDWIKVIPLDPTSPASTVTRSRPSIAVYQQSDGFANFCGLAAIAATWKEVDTELPNEVKVSLKLRTREFNLCTGEWFDWSPIYTVHEHTFDAQSTTISSVNNVYKDFGDDSTMLVVAPIVEPAQIDIDDKATFYIENVRTLLLGWTVTWTSPILTHSSGDIFADQTFDKFIYGVYSRSILRSSTVPADDDEEDMENYAETWGTYPAANFTACTSCIQPTNSSSGIKANIIYEPTQRTSHSTLGYPSVVSSENKTRWENTYNNYRQELAYSTLGVLMPGQSSGTKAGIWHKSLVYSRHADSLGKLTGNWPVGKGNFISGPFGTTLGYRFDRNPCITMNSSGQTFVAWESLRYQPGYYIGAVNGTSFQSIPESRRSAIAASNTDYSTNLWTTNGKTNLLTLISYEVPTMEWKYLLNPSISGSPKSHWLDNPNYASDQDPATVQLLYWGHLAFDGVTILNNLAFYHVFHEGRGEQDVTINGKSFSKAKGKGKWIDYHEQMTHLDFDSRLQGPGTNSQLSFSTYGGGLTFELPFNPLVENWKFYTLEWPTSPLTSSTNWSVSPFNYPFGNDKDDINEFVNVENIPGAYKNTMIDTFDANNYRHVNFVKDSSEARFIWGDVVVGADTASPLYNRSVGLRLGIRDSGAYNSIGEVMDSVFQTEIFDWYPNTEISYMRGLYVLDSNSIRSGGVYYDSSLYIKFTVELISGSQIDTVETAIFSPANAYYPVPISMHIPNGDTLIRDVSLRVRLSTYGISIPDTMWQFANEFTDDEYQTLDDSTTVAFKRSGKPVNFNGQDRLFVTNIHPNPAIQNQKIIFDFAYLKGEQVAISVYDVLGRTISSSTSLTSTGYWEEYSLQNNFPPGTYYIVVSAGGERKILPFVVTK